jgi:hypothetical protein
VVEDRHDGETFVVRSEREWWERLRGPEIELLAQRVRWAGGERAGARGDLVADYERLADLTVGAGVIPVTSGRDLCRAVDTLLRAVGGR